MNIVQRINTRQVYGCNCPANIKTKKQPFLSDKKFCIPFKPLLASKYELFQRGHVFLAFSSCGTYLYSYYYKTTNNGFLQLNFMYTLYWWKFNLWKPLQLVHHTSLFANHDIRESLLICVCDSYDSEYIVVHGTTETSQSKSAYVSVLSKPKEHFSLHFSYEVVSPHPSFPNQLSLKIPNTLFLNSGDTLFVISWSKLDIPKCCTDEKSCICSLAATSSDNLRKHSENLRECPDELKKCPDNLKQLKRFEEIYEMEDLMSDFKLCSDTIDEFLSFVVQGFSEASDGSSQDSPLSPFDFMATLMQCTVTSPKGRNCKLEYEHRCFKRADKGGLGGCSVIVNQAQFDVESFFNVIIQSDDALSRRFISVKDYDVEIIDVCDQSGSVIIVLNALLVLRDEPVPESDISFDNMSFNLYVMGYILEWTFSKNEIIVLYKKKPSTFKFVRHFNPSYSEAIFLKQKWTLPKCRRKTTSVSTNHNVFTGKSLPYLEHPYLPLVVSFDQEIEYNSE